MASKKGLGKRRIFGISSFMLGVLLFIFAIPGVAFSVLQNNFVIDNGSLCNTDDGTRVSCSSSLEGHIEAPSEAESATLTIFPSLSPWGTKSAGEKAPITTMTGFIYNYDTASWEQIFNIKSSDKTKRISYSFLVGEKVDRNDNVGGGVHLFNNWGECVIVSIDDEDKDENTQCTGLQTEITSEHIDPKDKKTVKLRFDSTTESGRTLASPRGVGAYLNSVNGEFILTPQEETQTSSETSDDTPSPTPDESDDVVEQEYSAPLDIQDPEESGLTPVRASVGGIGLLLILIGLLALPNYKKIFG